MTIRKSGEKEAATVGAGAQAATAGQPAASKGRNAGAPGRGKAAAAASAPVVQPDRKSEQEKGKKVKLIRDSFTIPEREYALVGEVKKRCVANGCAAKKSEVLRAAIASFAALSDAAIGKALAKLEPIKTGRPPKNAK